MKDSNESTFVYSSLWQEKTPIFVPNNRASGDIMHNRWWSEAEPPVMHHNNFEPR
ncbi:MAG: hypothetical protein LBL39_00880 [Planctomycetaceae bacterium]|nr:hypothetical protein [Planctomycetaceae bacterium]